MKYLITIVVIFSIWHPSCAQEIIEVYGKITDKHTQEPLPFVTVNLIGFPRGTVSDIDGNYSLTFQATGKDTIVIHMLSYETVKVPISGQARQEINIVLERSDINLTEVIIKPKNEENPADIIMRKVIAAKQKNDPSKIKKGSYEVYNKMELDLCNFKRENFTKNPLLKEFSFILDNVDSSSDEKPFLPLFLTETLSDFYFSLQPKNEREIIKASKLSGIKQENIVPYLGSMYQKFSIYDNWLPTLGKDFASPVSDNGFTFYKYYLIDSAVMDNQLCYKLHFRPKRKNELTYFGDIWIAKDNYGIKLLNMQASSDVDLNFVERLVIFQSFQVINSNTWFKNKDKFIVEFKPTKNAAGLIGRKTTTYRDFKQDTSRIDSILTFKDEIIVSENTESYSEKEWQQFRHEELSKNEQTIYNMVDTLQTIPTFKTYVNVISLLVGGYHDIWIFDIGPYVSMISNDRIEGYRFRIGGRTNELLNKNFRLKGYAAYGLRDQKLKYSYGADVILSRKPWQSISMEYKYDFDLEKGNLEELDEDNFMTSVLRKKMQQKLIFLKQRSFNYTIQLNKSITATAFFNNRYMEPSFKFNYNATESLSDRLTTTEVGALIRFAPGEQFINSTYTRLSLGTLKPILTFKYSRGIKGIFDSQFEYDKIALTISDNFNINPWGTFKFRAAGGKIFGTLPYLLLEVPKGNYTYYFNPNSYNNMNPYEFTTDEFVSLDCSHHFNGLLLGKIPLLKKLKWRSFIEGKSIIGRLSESNIQLNDMTLVKSFENIPYMEVGAGIENIFKLIRIDVVKRLTHLQGNNITKFAFYASLQFQF